MSTLSHITKVKIRRAIKALRTMDEKQYLLEDQGFQVIANPIKPPHQVAIKAGFLNRADLEQFARKHHLL